MKAQVPIEVRQDKIDILLSALKTAESHYTKEGEFMAAAEVHKLNISLRRQIFSYEEETNE
jgi:hemerythrin